MLSKIAGGTALLLGGISLIVDTAKGCWNVEMTSFANKEKLTDFLTDGDEITIQFGVGEIVRF